MIITEANEFVSKIHDRMPVLLTPFQFDAWLTGTQGRGTKALRDQFFAGLAGVAAGEQFARA